MVSASTIVPVAVKGGQTRFAQGMIAGLALCGAYLYAYCFTFERKTGMLDLLLSLPLSSRNLVLAKFASLYSMVLFTTNVSGLFTGEYRTLFMVNCFAILLSTASMAAAVISERAWAPTIPLLMAIPFMAPLENWLWEYYPDGLDTLEFMTSHVMHFAIASLVIAPIIALASAVYFASTSSRV